MREINLGRVKGDDATINGYSIITITDGVGITLTQNGSSLTIAADTDSAPTENSSKPVTSGGVYTAIAGITLSGLGAGSAAVLNAPSTGNAGNTEVVLGSDTRLTDARNAADVYDWAKASSKPSYNYSEIGNTPTLGTAAALNVAATGNAGTSEVVKGNDTRLTDARNAADVYSWAKASTKPTYTANEVGAIPSTDKGAVNGVAELDANGLVPASQLPSFVDDVRTGTASGVTQTAAGTYSATGFILTGESTQAAMEVGVTYVDTTSNIQYRWTGTSTNLVSMGSNLALGETNMTAYAGNKGKANADAISAIKNGSSINTFGGVETALSDKVDKVAGKGLSTNDYDASAVAEVAKVAGKADENQTFTAASTRANIDSGESFATILGKIKKFFADIADLAFISKDGVSSTKFLRGDGTWQSIPAQAQADWSQSTSTAVDYIKNKPTSETAASGGTTESLVTTGEKYTWNNKLDPSGNAASATLAKTISVNPTDTTNLNIWIEAT